MYGFTLDSEASVVVFLVVYQWVKHCLGGHLLLNMCIVCQVFTDDADVLVTVIGAL